MATSSSTVERPSTRAQVRYVRMSASKVRVVLDLIRGKQVNEALQILTFSERLAARDIAKVLRSAIANAEHNDGQTAEELVVAACYADEGPTLKRFRPKARGRAGKINKRTTHITIEVARMTDEQLDIVRRKADRSGRPAAGDTSASRRRRVARSRGEQPTAPAAISADGAEATSTVASDEAGTEEVAGQISSTGTDEVAGEGAAVTDVTTESDAPSDATDTAHDAAGATPETQLDDERKDD